MGVATKEISQDMKVTQRRVQQELKDYKKIGHEPVYGENVGRPRRHYNETEAKKIVKETHYRYRFGARMLEYVISKQYKVCISHNRIHMNLRSQGLTQQGIKE